LLNRIFGVLGRSTRAFLADTGSLARLGAAACSSAFVDPFRGGRLRLQASIVQAARAGNGSLPLVGLICFLVGMIMALQAAQQLRQLGATDLVAGLVAISITRELAPLLVAIIVAGRFGSAVAAELGTMQVSQEIDALNVMGIDPISFLVVPRLLALIASLPCLIIFADVIGILGGQTVATGLLGIGGARYIALTLDALVLEDIYTGLVKGIAFAGIIGLVSCHQGLSTRGGAEQVGHSTTASVVRSIVLVIGADLFVTVIFYLKA
jgi:phospholipid/cholesterol/gamma-HCH transport system permease protein